MGALRLWTVLRRFHGGNTGSSPGQDINDPLPAVPTGRPIRRKSGYLQKSTTRPQ